jgi:hypothetical protein
VLFLFVIQVSNHDLIGFPGLNLSSHIAESIFLNFTHNFCFFQ